MNYCPAQLAIQQNQAQPHAAYKTPSSAPPSIGIAKAAAEGPACIGLLSALTHCRMSLIEQQSASPKPMLRNRGFQKGNQLATGRPTGSRDKLTRAFLYELADTFQRKGKKAMERLADEDPAAFIRVCASLMPKDVKLTAGPLAELTEQELSALAYAAQRLAASETD